ncbi:MAG: aspartate kinase [Firmicutes bacterium]|nr:aspartate kinase [Bacillota bacterium]
MTTIVQKYGGTSIGTIDNIKSVAKRIIKRKKQGNNVVVVVSAMGKSTDNLINMAKEVTKEPCKRELDMLVSTGEQVTISLLSMTLKEMGYDSISLTGFQAGIVTNDIHTKAKISDIDIKKVNNYLNDGKIVVVAGFQGINNKGDITTLGRGGSDTTAVALAAKLNSSCEIYTDVDGVYSVDPRQYPNSKKLDYICYEEMLEMASLGANIMESRAVEIGQKYCVPIYVALSTSEKKGTYIKEFDNTMEEKVITGLTVSDDDLMVTINNIPYDNKNISLIFQKLAENSVNIDMISQTAPTNGYINVSFTAPEDSINLIKRLTESFKEKFKDINTEIQKDITKISVVGLGMRDVPGVAAKIFKIFSENNIEFKLVTTSEIRISYAINTEGKCSAVKLISEEFNL